MVNDAFALGLMRELGRVMVEDAPWRETALRVIDSPLVMLMNTLVLELLEKLEAIMMLRLERVNEVYVRWKTASLISVFPSPI